MMIDMFATEAAYKIMRNSVQTRMSDLYEVATEQKQTSWSTRITADRKYFPSMVIFRMSYETLDGGKYIHHMGWYDPVKASGMNDAGITTIYAAVVKPDGAA